MMTDLLNQILTSIGTVTEGLGGVSFSLVNELVEAYGESDLANRLYADIPEEVPWQVVARLFNGIIWSTTDNGAALCYAVEGWLATGDDLRKARIGLALEVFLYPDSGQMEEVLCRLARRFPEVKIECDCMIYWRRQQVH